MMETKKTMTEILVKLLSDSRNELLKAGVIKTSDMGCCVYPDINSLGDTIYGDNWSQAMSDYAGGNFHPAELCEDQPAE